MNGEHKVSANGLSVKISKHNTYAFNKRLNAIRKFIYIQIFYYIKNILIKIGISDKLNAQQCKFVFSILSKKDSPDVVRKY